MRASRTIAAATAALSMLVTGLVASGTASAADDPAGCTQNIQYDPSVPTFKDVAAAHPEFSTNNGQSLNALGGFQTGTNNRHPAEDLYTYARAIETATANNPRVKVITKNIGTTFEGREFVMAVVGTPAHINNLETDAAFWRGVRDGSVPEDVALTKLESPSAPPAFGWSTETPHGGEPAGGEASMRFLYELAARTDCANQRRLANMDSFIDPARNPDGRFFNTRTTAYSFDPNRDLAFQTQDVNTDALDNINKYPGLYFIDAHQQTSGYFFPPNEDPVLHEISDFAINTIQDTIGEALQQRFNDQGLQYRNYNAYDLFANEYGDAGPSLFMGAAGMTYEKGSNEVYGKQVYDHYLAMDETLNAISADKDQLSADWVKQWAEAKEQGEQCKLQGNKLVSPLHQPPSGEIAQEPTYDICGFYIRAGENAGDVARMVDLLRGRDIKVYKFDQAVNVTGAHDFGTTSTTSETLPAGTIYIPAGQTMKHWLISMMEEDPFIPYPYFYDVVNWSVPELFNLGGGGQLQSPLPAVAPMTQITGSTSLGGVVSGGGAPVYAFATDSSKALGLVTQLLATNATVYRAQAAFNSGGVHYPTGTALVDGSSISAGSLQSLSSAAQTPVQGIADYPSGARFQMATPKIGMYTGGTTAPNSPVFPGVNAHCTSTAYCEMVFALAKEMNVPVSRLYQVTSTDLAAGRLVNEGFTAFVNAGSTIAAGAGATALQAFVNQGGNYIGYNAGGATSARNAGLTTLNTASTTGPPWNAHCADNLDPTAAGSLTTPGTAFNATYNTTNPVSWGFDSGGYIYREASGDAVFDTTTLGTATAAASYPDPLKAYGYQCNAVAPGALPGRPYAVDQPFGAGHAIILGSDVFFRGWTAGPQRLVMNGILYPAANSSPYYGIPGKRGQVAKGVRLTKKQLRSAKYKVKSRPVRKMANPLADATVLVKAKQAAKLSTVVSNARLPKALRKHVSYKRIGKYVRLTIKGAAKYPHREKGAPAHLKQLWTKGDLELRPMWAWRIIRGMQRRGVRTVAHNI